MLAPATAARVATAADTTAATTITTATITTEPTATVTAIVRSETLPLIHQHALCPRAASELARPEFAKDGRGCRRC
jgi:hypothetical protein